MFYKSGNGNNTHPKNQNSQVGGSNFKGDKKRKWEKVFHKGKELRNEKKFKGNLRKTKYFNYG